MKIGLWVCLIFLISITIFSWVRFITFQHKLWNYLFENYVDKWKELTSIGDFGPGIANSRRGIKFLFSREDFNDADLLRLKVISRNAFLYVITGFIAIFFWAFIMVGILGD